MVGIISAMQEEIQTLLENLQNTSATTKGMRTYYKGMLFNQPVVLVFSRWGKVAAATTVTQLINDFKIDEVIFTGVAGSIQNHINIGDIVIGKNLYQHDMDASPLMEPFEIPLLQKKYFETSNKQTQALQRATQLFLNDFDKHITNKQAVDFYIKKPKVIIENIASGDQFVSKEKQVNYINHNLPNIACVEMEGAAVAQVCFEYSIPFALFRTISDKANNDAYVDFPKFVDQIASHYALEILKNYFTITA